MNRGLVKLILIISLIGFGILFGLDSKEDVSVTPSDKSTFIDPNYYIARIEDGKFVFVPIEQPNQIQVSTELDNNQINEEIITQEKSINNKIEGPIMNRHGTLDKVGYNLSKKVSEWTRSALEKSIGLLAN